MIKIDRPARFTEAILFKAKPGLLAVLVTLKDFVIVTFAVEPAALKAHLPEGFEPETRILKDGSECAFVSAVTFQDVDFRLNSCPWPKFSFGQTNYRAYVIYRGMRVGWFFGTSLATPFVHVPRNLWMLPWHSASMKFDTEWKENVCTKYVQSTEGTWGKAEIILEGTSEKVNCLDGFDDDEDTAVVLTHPLIAYYRRRDNRIGTYGIWHDKLDLQKAVATKASFEVFEQLGLISQTSKPHSVLIQKSTDFTILLPPKLDLNSKL